MNKKMIFNFKARNLRNKEKPLLRRKSELPQDTGVAKAINSYQRADDYLKSPPDSNNC
jgi:serine/threonine-protein phosphatase 2A regulatory subunit B'